MTKQELNSLLEKKIEGVKLISIMVKLPYEVEVSEANFDFGSVTITCEDRKFVTDVVSSNWGEDVIRLKLEVTKDVLYDTKQDITATDLMSNDIKVDVYIGCEYTVEPDHMTLFVRFDGGLTKAIEVNKD